jgi:hypothetical protein
MYKLQTILKFSYIWLRFFKIMPMLLSSNIFWNRWTHYLFIFVDMLTYLDLDSLLLEITQFSYYFASQSSVNQTNHNNSFIKLLKIISAPTIMIGWFLTVTTSCEQKICFHFFMVCRLLKNLLTKQKLWNQK